MANVTTNEDYVKAKTLLARKQAEKIDFQLGVQRGEYIKLTEAAKKQEEEASRIKTKLLALPARITPRLVTTSDTSEIYSILWKCVTEILNELADNA